MYEELADRLMTAITRGDTDTVRGLYAPGALIWFNGPGPGGGTEQDVADNLRTLRWLARNLAGLRYDDIRRDPLPGGYVQRHVLHGHLADGAPVEIAACLFVTVDGDGHITRIEEYADSRATGPLRALAAAQREQRHT
jgi:uncharacterized protein